MSSAGLNAAAAEPVAVAVVAILSMMLWVVISLVGRKGKPKKKKKKRKSPKRKGGGIRNPSPAINSSSRACQMCPQRPARPSARVTSSVQRTLKRRLLSNYYNHGVCISNIKLVRTINQAIQNRPDSRSRLWSDLCVLTQLHAKPTARPRPTTNKQEATDKCGLRQYAFSFFLKAKVLLA